jgi:hypothetical protein
MFSAKPGISDSGKTKKGTIQAPERFIATRHPRKQPN